MQHSWLELDFLASVFAVSRQMRAVVQRVLNASVTVEGAVVGKIERGLMVLVGITHEDTREDMEYMSVD